MSATTKTREAIALAGAVDAGGDLVLGAAIRDPAVVARYRAKIVDDVDGSGCWWWTGALSGRGHGRFWVAGPRVVIAHRFGFALEHGAAALTWARVLGHRCDNPLCQRIGPGHVVVSSPEENRREWAIRRHLAGSPVGDRRGSRERAVVMRNLVRRDPQLLAEELQRLRIRHGQQLALW